MQNNFKSKLSLILGLLLIIVGLIYLFTLQKEDAPLIIESPEIYPEGTQVLIYKNIPPDFPEGVILETSKPEHSGTLTSPEGRKQIRVAYLSDKKVPELLEQYQASLSQEGWIVTIEALEHGIRIIKAIKLDQTLIITMSEDREEKSALSFQYEK